MRRRVLQALQRAHERDEIGLLLLSQLGLEHDVDSSRSRLGYVSSRTRSSGPTTWAVAMACDTLLRRHASIDDMLLGRNEGRLIGGKEHHQLRNFIRVRHS